MAQGAHQATTKRMNKRDQLWPDAAKEVFNAADGAKGYTRIPRVIPLMARLANELGGAENAGPLYQVLWAQDWGQGLIEIRSYKSLLFEAGYTGKGARVERTWNERIGILTKLGLIRTAARGLEEFGYVLLIDPHRAALRLEQEYQGRPEFVAWWREFQLFCESWGINLDSYRQKLANEVDS